MKKFTFFIAATLFFSTAQQDAQCPVEMPGWASQTPLPISQNQCMSRAKSSLESNGFTGIISQDGWIISGYKGNLKAGISCISVTGGTMANVSVATPKAEGTLATSIRDNIMWCILNGNCEGSKSNNTTTTNTGKTIKWGETPMTHKLRGQIGKIFCFTCESTKIAGGSLWGTDEYTDDSSICSAALHAGKITTSGGSVCIQITAGRNSYTRSTRNGITSGGYGKWPGSFIFEEGSPSVLPPDEPFIQLEPPNSINEWKVDFGDFKINGAQIDAIPAGDGKTSYYIAPNSYKGNLAGFRTLTFDKKSWGGYYGDPDSYGAIGDVVLQNGSKTARFDIPKDHSQTWKTYVINFNDPSWKLSGGARTINDVLSNVTSFKIRAEYGVGTDFSSLRNVIIK